MLVFLLCLLSVTTGLNGVSDIEIAAPKAQAQTSIARGGKHADNEKCEALTIPLCSRMPYNKTIMPNILGQNQKEAAQALHPFGPLMKLNCSDHFQRFMCTAHAPPCTSMDKPVPPCRSLCYAAQSECEEQFKNFDQWPKNLECSQFPVGSDGLPCIEKESSSDSGRDKSDFPQYGGGGNGGHDVDPRFQMPSTRLPQYLPNYPGAGMQFVCPAHLEVEPARKYKLYIGEQTVDNCGAPCTKMFFTLDQLEFSRYWVGCWALVSLLSCLFTVFSFLIDVSRFGYPERPIIYLSACFAMVAVAFIVGFAMGDEISCNEQPDTSLANLLKERTIRQGFLEDWRCTILFMIIYFFLMAGSLWWVMLTICWFLSASLKWGQEAIDSKSQWFHLIAWGLPAVITIIVQVIRKVEGDILTGTCFVGLWDVWSMRWLVLAPLLVYISIGTIFLLLGLFSLIKIRTVMKQDGGKTDKLEKLILRIGIFSILYTVPAFIIIACLFYEQFYFSSWMLQWQDSICRGPKYRAWQIPCPPRDKNFTGWAPRPDFTVYMIKYLMILIIGIFSGFWVWTEKTLQTWTNFFRRLFGLPRRQAYV